MTAHFLLTVTGPWRAGLIGELAEKTIACGGTWLINKSIHVEGRIALIIKVAAPADQVPALRAELSNLPGYAVEFAASAPQPEAGPRPATISFRAHDRSGLTRDLHRVMDDNGLLTEHLDVRRLAVGGIGESVFTCSARVLIPEDCDPVALRAELEAIEQGAVVELES
jgi:glycine cleavage system regulatory protein